jgi:hypothetical protein
MSTPPVEDRLHHAAILGRAALAWAVLVVAHDVTALSVALPAMEEGSGRADIARHP